MAIRRLAVLAALVLSFSASPAAPQQGQITGLPILVMRDHLIEGRRVGILARDWLYCYPPTGELIVVPRGYITDFASIPAALEPVLDSFGRQSEAAVVHDWLYAVGETDKREVADSIFLFAMMEQGVGLAARRTMYQGVVLGGGSAYGRADEWNKRFGNPDSGRRLASAPYARRKTAVVAEIDCKDLDDPAKVQTLAALHSSANWPRPIAPNP